MFSHIKNTIKKDLESDMRLLINDFKKERDG